jgi:hypothetical protein
MKGKHVDNKLKKGKTKLQYIENIDFLLDLKLPTTKGDWIVIYEKIDTQSYFNIY